MSVLYHFISRSRQLDSGQYLSNCCLMLQPFPNRHPGVTIKDESRYGTWVNDAQLPSKGQVELKDGDKLKFGSPKSSFM